MWQTILPLLYPLSAFIFIRLALRSIGKWAASPRPIWMTLGILGVAFTFHTSWLLFGLTATTPHWWAKWLVAIALAWVAFKNLRQIWKFESLRTKTPQKMT